MAENLLEQLQEMTEVVADTGELQAMARFNLKDATTNPSLIAASAKLPEYQEAIQETLKQTTQELGKDASAIQIATSIADKLAVVFGVKILNLISGQISTEVDVRLFYDADATLNKARYLISLYEKAGISRVLIKIAATWEGICAAKILKQEGIQCNLTLLFRIHQAIACAEAGVSTIAPYVGRVSEWYKRETGRDYYPPAEEPGVVLVTQIYNYYKKFDYQTKVMAASFRNLEQIKELAGCDLLTISPILLGELQSKYGKLERKLSPEKAANLPINKTSINYQKFKKMHRDNRMASEQLAAGIKGFTKDLESLETLLMEKLNVFC